jgi:hypothetical protein
MTHSYTAVWMQETQKRSKNWRGGPHISFRTSFPKPGLYKVWGQFQHKGKIIMADFVLEVVSPLFT